MTFSRRFAALSLVLVFGAVSLTACSVSIADPGATPSATPPVASAPNAPLAPSPSASGPHGVVDDERMARLQRTRWTDAVAQHVVCVNGEYTVDHNADGIVVEVTGDCREVTIVADAATVLLPAVDELKVTGDGNILILASGRQITLDADADANLVGWESGTPVVKDSGTLNATTPIS